MNSKTLKMIAIAAMTIDHITWLFVPLESVAGQLLHTIGRLAGPIMFFFIAEGYVNTRSVPKYAARLGTFAVISQVPYIYFWTGNLPTMQNIFSGNVLFTLLLGLLAIWISERANTYTDLHNKATWPLITAYVIIILLCAASSSCDWQHWGILFTLFFWAARRKPNILLWGIPISTIMRFSELTHASGTVWENLYQLGILLVIPLIYLYNGNRGKGGKWFFYIFYPAHLLILGMVRWWLLA